MIESQKNISGIKDPQKTAAENKYYEQNDNNGFKDDLKNSQTKLKKKETGDEAVSYSSMYVFPWGTMQNIFINNFEKQINDKSFDFKERINSDSRIKADTIKNPQSLQKDADSTKNGGGQSSTQKTGHENLSQKISQNLFETKKFIPLPFSTFIPISDFIKNTMERIEKLDIKSFALKIIDDAKLLKDGEKTTLTVDLKPDWLGNIIIRISSDKGILNINIFASESAKSELDSKIRELENAFKAANLNIGNLQVSVGGQGHQEKSSKDNYDWNGLLPLNFYSIEKEPASLLSFGQNWRWFSGNIYSKV